MPCEIFDTHPVARSPGLPAPSDWKVLPSRRLDPMSELRAWRDSRHIQITGRVVKWLLPTANYVLREGRWCYEYLTPYCFSDDIASGRNIRAFLDNHDGLLEIAQTDDGSLGLVEDDDGLHYTLKIPDTRMTRILCDYITKGLFRGMSPCYRRDYFYGVMWKDEKRYVLKAELHEITFVLTGQPSWRSGTARLNVPIIVKRKRLDALQLVK